MIRANENKEKVTTFIEDWAGHFGLSDDRQNGSREIYFDDNTMDVAEQISSSLKAIGVIPEVFMECTLTQEEQGGFLQISQMITEAACKALDFLVEDRQSERGRNAPLRREVESVQAEKEQLEQRVKQAEIATDPNILQVMQGNATMLKGCALFMNAIKDGTCGKDMNEVYSELIGKLAEIDVPPSDIIDHLAKAGHEVVAVVA